MALLQFSETVDQITDFEKSTIVPMIIDTLAFRTDKTPITSAAISKWLKACGNNISESRVRKIISFASTAGMKKGIEEHLGSKVIIGGGRGYFVTELVDVVDDQIDDLHRRINNMRSRVESLEAQKLNLKHKQSAQ